MALQIIHEAWRMLWDYLVNAPILVVITVITMSTAPFFGSAVSSVTKRHARVGLNGYPPVPPRPLSWSDMDADEREHILEEIFADSGSDISSDESSPPTSEYSDEEHIPTIFIGKTEFPVWMAYSKCPGL